MNDRPQSEPDWVQARYDCSAERLLDQLWRRVEQDVLQWNRLHNTVRFIADSRVERDVYQFAVFRKDRRDAKVVFSWNAASQSIDVTAPAGTALHVQFGVSQAGECVYRIDGAELQAWEVSRRTLEDFLFAD